MSLYPYIPISLFPYILLLQLEWLKPRCQEVVEEERDHIGECADCEKYGVACRNIACGREVIKQPAGEDGE